MAQMDISKLNFDELTELKSAIDLRLAGFLEIRREALLRELEDLEVQISKATGTTRQRRRTPAQRKKPRYTGPNGQTWRGSGRTPRWLVEYEAKGGNRADFETDK